MSFFVVKMVFLCAFNYGGAPKFQFLSKFELAHLLPAESVQPSLGCDESHLVLAHRLHQPPNTTLSFR